jgi:hypothetical protein
VVVADDRFGAGGVGHGVGATGGYDSGLAAPAPKQWHHIVAVWRQGVAAGSHVVLDGRKGAATTANNGEGRGFFTVGGIYNTDNYGLSGFVRRLRIYGTALSDASVTALYRHSLAYQHRDATLADASSKQQELLESPLTCPCCAFRYFAPTLQRLSN